MGQLEILQAKESHLQKKELMLMTGEPSWLQLLYVMEALLWRVVAEEQPGRWYERKPSGSHGTCEPNTVP